MVIQPQDEVWFIRDNQIYKGIVQEQVPTVDSLFWYYRVKTCFGLQIMAFHEIYYSVDRLVDSIIHETSYNEPKKFVVYMMWYIYNNQIYRGNVVEQFMVDGDDQLYFRVETHYGLQVMPVWALKDTVEELAESIIHESCWG